MSICTCSQCTKYHSDDTLAIQQYMEIEEAFLEVLEHDSDFQSIKRLTGLPDKRCKEIEALYKKCEIGWVS